MAQSELDANLEKIIDEAEGTTNQVVVQARPSKSSINEVATRAALAMKERMFSQSAREVTPPRKGESALMRSMSESAVYGRLLEQRSSMKAQTSRAPAFDNGKQVVETEGGAAAGKLLKTAPLNKAAAEKETGRRRLETLWIADSVFAELTKDELAALRNEADTVLNVYPNVRFKQPDYARLASLPATVIDNKTSAYGIEASGAMAAWGAYGSKGAGVRIAVLDTGIDASHPDLAGKVAAFAEFDNAGNIIGTTPRDDGEHGSHVAGTIAGGNASGSYIGMAPDAQLLGGLVLPGGGGSVAQIIAGIQWAVSQNADVINMSLGGLTTDVAVPEVFTNAVVGALVSGVPVAVAIGNEGNQTTGNPGNELFSFAVGATASRDEVAGFSGGRTHLLTNSTIVDPNNLPLPYMKPEISAPGVAVMSSIPGNDYAPFSGTSMATPHVAGAVALLLANSSIREQETGADRAFLIQDMLIASVEELGENGQDHRFGFGRLNVLRAIGMAHEQGYMPATS